MAYHHVAKRTHEKAIELLKEGKLSKRAISDKLKVSYGTIMNWSKELGEDSPKRMKSRKTKLYKCQEKGCSDVAEGMLGGKWLCHKHRGEETARRVEMMNQKLAKDLNVEVVPIPNIQLPTPEFQAGFHVPQETPEAAATLILSNQEPKDIASGHRLALEQQQAVERLQGRIAEIHQETAAAMERGEGVKYDGNKPRMDLIDASAMEGLAWVLTKGAEKYSPNNWRHGMKWSRLIAAALRHINDFNKGIDNDKEWNLSHIDHAMCCLMFLSNYIKERAGEDDRWASIQKREAEDDYDDDM